MMHNPHFVQECPICGRPLQIRVEYLGRLLTCRHCGGRFTAKDSVNRVDSAPRANSLLARADHLLKISTERLSEVE
jgi:hypothetical protein